jgi:hypothetical protein
MKLPKTETPEKYVGLYVIDFGGQCAMGYTAEEVATLLESEQFADVKVYKIYRANPDGQMELQVISRERFASESGMFFHCRDERGGYHDYQQILQWSGEQCPPCRAKLQLARSSDQSLLVALIYPAEYEQEMGRWLADSGFQGSGVVDAGISQVTRYYQNEPEIIQREQLWPAESRQSRSFDQLRACVGVELQR